MIPTVISDISDVKKCLYQRARYSKFNKNCSAKDMQNI